LYNMGIRVTLEHIELYYCLACNFSLGIAADFLHYPESLMSLDQHALR